MTTPPPSGDPGLALPTRAELLRATGVALVAAAMILVTIVAPAEYGLDPTGIGSRLGLRRPSAVSAISSSPPTAEAAAMVKRESAPFRTDQMQVTLEWGEDVEVKASMLRGQQFVFSWTAEGGKVNVDMHGEPSGTPNGDATSYWKAEDQTSAHGTFEAPFDGLHGWYWENFTENPVTITLKTSGYYSTLAKQ